MHALFLVIVLLGSRACAGQPQPLPPPKLPGGQPGALPQQGGLQGAAFQEQQQIPLRQPQQPGNPSLVPGSTQALTTEEEAAFDTLLQANQQSGPDSSIAVPHPLQGSFAQEERSTSAVPLWMAAMAPAMSPSSANGGITPPTPSAGGATASSGSARAPGPSAAGVASPPAPLNRLLDSEFLNPVVNMTYNPRSTEVGSAVNAPPFYPLMTQGNLIPDKDVQLSIGSTLVEGSGVGPRTVSVRLGYQPRTAMVYSEQQILNSCTSQAFRLILGPCGPALPSVAPFANGVAAADCRVVAVAVRAAGSAITSACCPDLRKFIMDGCNCDPVSTAIANSVGLSNNLLIATARAGMVSICSGPTYGGYFTSPCSNVKLCASYQAWQQLNITAPPSPRPAGALAPAGAALSPVGIQPGTAAAPSGIASPVRPALPGTALAPSSIGSASAPQV